MSDRVPPALTLSQTPRFPDRIAVGVPSQEPLPLQNETMAAWFLSRYGPATRTYFGFSGHVTRLLRLVANSPIRPPRLLDRSKKARESRFTQTAIFQDQPGNPEFATS